MMPHYDVNNGVALFETSPNNTVAATGLGAFAPININGHSKQGLFDTGSSHNLVSLSILNTLRMPYKINSRKW